MLRHLPMRDAGDNLIPHDKFHPSDEVESKLADIWLDLLKVETVSVNTAFFVVGGNSLSAVILLSKIHKVFDVRLTLEDIFKKPTIRQLAAVIKRAETTGYSSIKPVENKDFYPLSAAQKRIYLLQQMDEDGTSYNVHQLISLGIELDKGKAEKIFNKLIKRHESLKMSFENVEGVPVKRIRRFNEVGFKIKYYEINKNHDWKSKTETSFSAIFTYPGFAFSSGISHNSYPSFFVPSDFVQPFDLSRAPLFRVAILKYDTGKSLMMIDIHHIITDGTSQEIMLNEFAVLYSGGELPALELQYEDWVEWLNLEEQEHFINKQQEFWINEFIGDIPILNLPTDYRRPDIQSFEGNCLHFSIQREETRQLKAMALKEDVTLFILLLAIFYVFLTKLSGDEDIVIGIPAAGRRHADMQSIVGMFVNTLAIRNFPKREKTFTCFLKEVKVKTVAAFDNQEYPFDKLVKQVLHEREANRNPLFDVLLVFHSYLLPPGEIPQSKLSAKLDIYEYEYNTSQTDLHLSVIERDEGLFFSLAYCKKLFEEETIKQFTMYFQELVSIVLENSEIRLVDINISHQLLNSQLEVLQEDQEDFAF
jgi:acyl carrier protein